MRLQFLLVAVCSPIAAVSAPSSKLTGAAATIYFGTYAKRIAVIDEATEKVTAEIRLKTGISFAVHLHVRKRKRFRLSRFSRSRSMNRARKDHAIAFTQRISC